MQGIRNYVEHSTILVYLVGKHDCTLVSMKWSPSFSLKLSNCMMETCMLVAGGEGPWALVTPVKAIRVGMGLYKKYEMAALKLMYLIIF